MPRKVAEKAIDAKRVRPTVKNVAKDDEDMLFVARVKARVFQGAMERQEEAMDVRTHEIGFHDIMIQNVGLDS